jgi:hypothetical protein
MNTPKRSLLLALTLACALLPAHAQAAAGDLYVSGFSSQSIVRISPDGTVNPVVSNLVGPGGMAFDSKGILYVGQYNGTIVKIVNGSVVPFASGLANQSAHALAFDKFGILYVTETNGGVVTKITPDGTKTNFDSSLPTPGNLAFDYQGNLFVSVFGASSTEGIIYKYASTGRTTFGSSLRNPEGLAFDASGNLYEADTAGTTINRFTPAGSKAPFALGSGVRFLAFDLNRNLFAATDNTISKVAPNAAVSPFKNVSTVGGLAVEPPLSQPLNISTLLKVQTGDNALFGGFITSGNAPKKVVIRAIGPSLSSFGVTTPLQDPTLELRSANGSLIASNDNWKINDQTHQSQQAAIQATGLAPTDDRESALMAELGPAGYTAIVRGKNDTIGTGLLEIYDINQAADSRLANISTRGYIDTDRSTIIAGVIIGSGNGAAKVLVRVLGPSLTAFGITNPLKNPEVNIRDANGTSLAYNNDWKTRGENIVCPCASQQAEIEATGLQPSNGSESAVIVTLPVGNHTAVANGSNYFGNGADTTGVAVVEVYNLR